MKKQITLLAAGAFFALTGHMATWAPLGFLLELSACGCFFASVFAK